MEEDFTSINTQTRKLADGLLHTVGQWLRATDPPLTEDVKRIILTGINTYDYPLLADYFHDQSGIDVFIPNPFQDLTEKKIPGRIVSALAMATGLAAKGLKEKFSDINLLPPEMRIRRTSHAFSFSVFLLVLLFLLLTATAYTGSGKNSSLYFPNRIKLKKVFNASNY